MDDPRPDFTREPMDRFGWEKLLRRAVIKPPSIKMLGLVMATYANEDGSKIHPGQKRLANVMGTSVSTVDRGQRALEDLGFIEMVRKGHSAGRGQHAKGYASEYRLTVPSDLLESIPMLDKDGNHPSPVTCDSEKHTAPMTGDSAALPTSLGKGLPQGLGEATPSRDSRESDYIHVNPEYIHVTGEESHVNLPYSHVTHDVPPSHLHNPNNQPINHQGSPVTLSDAREENRDETRITRIGGDPDWEQMFFSASQHLQNLRDHGTGAMNRVRESEPDSPLQRRVISAAKLTGWNPPGMEAAS